jgi:hypothetical protein
MAAPALLLLDFLHDDLHNQHRDEAFPFLLGWARREGREARWLDVPAGRATRPREPYVVEALAAEDHEALGRVLRAIGPAVVVSNEKLGGALADLVRDAGVRALVEVGRPERVVESLAPWLPELGGFAHVTLDALGTPLYACEVLGGGTLQAPPLQPIVAGSSCVYRRPIAHNRHFAGVPLGAGVAEGCSFCALSTLPVARPRGDAVEVALDQVRQFFATAPAHRRPGRFKLVSGLVFARLGAFLDGLAALEPPASELYLTCRIDEVLRQGEALRRFLSTEAARGVSIHVWNIGLENFSPTENERFNKGLAEADIAAAVTLLDGLEGAFPGRFAWRRHGGFGLITFTPWTTPADLELNLAGLAAHDLGFVMGGMLTSRLQLLPGTAVLALARHHGLTLETGAALSAVPVEVSCLTAWDESEVPWRFREPQVEALYRALLTVCPREGEPREPDLPSALAGNPVPALRALLDAAKREPALDAEGLLAALAKAARRVRPAEGPTSSTVPVAAQSRALVARLRALLDAVTAGGTVAFAGYDVIAVAPGAGDAAAAELSLRRRGGRDRLVVTVQVDADPDAPAYLRAGGLCLTHAADTPPTTPRAQAAMRALGELLARARRQPRRSSST